MLPRLLSTKIYGLNVELVKTRGRTKKKHQERKFHSWMKINETMKRKNQDTCRTVNEMKWGKKKSKMIQ